MVQLKFALFAAIVLGLWFGQVYVSASMLSARAIDAAMVHATITPSVVSAKIDERRREFQRAAAQIAGPNTVAALQMARSKGEAPGLERFGPLRDAALAAVSESLRGQLVFGLSNELGSVYSRGSGKPVQGKGEVDLPALAQAGSEGVWHEAFGVPHVFFSFPASSDRSEPTKQVGFAVVGLPLGAEGILGAAAKDSGLDAIVLIQAGKVVSIAGPEKIKPEQIDRNIAPGRTAVVASGALSSIGPFRFPLFTNGDVLGGRAPLWVASRQAVLATPYEVMGLVTLKPFMQALAGYQKLALLGFVLILGLGILGVVIGRRGTLSEADYGEPRSIFSAALQRSSSYARGDLRRPSRVEPPDEDRVADSGMDERRSSTGDVSPPWFTSSVPHPAQPVSPNPPPLASAGFPNPLESRGADHRSAGRQTFFGNSDFGRGNEPTPTYSPAETRVANIPEELLRASAFPNEMTPEQLLTPPQKMPSVSTTPSDADEGHFRDVFRDFLSIRAQCGEPSDGITYERFAAKLRKNRDQLIEKYNCRTVRFQVYVKEGKAALKATPVRV